MARKRKVARPADPMAMARRRAEARRLERDPGRWGIDPALAALAVNAQVRLTPDAAGRIARARRQDVFDLMQARGKLTPAAFEAVRRLQDDLAILHRTLTGGGDLAPRVDRSRTADGLSDARLRAGARIEAALARTGAASATLLAALCEGETVASAPADWRAVVARVTGEHLPDAQGAILRAACENLAGAYAALRRGNRA